jgi:hypothetical protein
MPPCSPSDTLIDDLDKLAGSLEHLGYINHATVKAGADEIRRLRAEVVDVHAQLKRARADRDVIAQHCRKPSGPTPNVDYDDD